jgi:hypothetical protein
MCSSYGVGSCKIPLQLLKSLLGYKTVTTVHRDLASLAVEVIRSEGDNNIKFAKFIKAHRMVIKEKVSLVDNHSLCCFEWIKSIFVVLIFADGSSSHHQLRNNLTVTGQHFQRQILQIRNEVDMPVVNRTDVFEIRVVDNYNTLFLILKLNKEKYLLYKLFQYSTTLNI